jgi:hypothetical protein
MHKCPRERSGRAARAPIGASVAVLAAAGVIAACGGTKASDPAAQVKSTWTAFFSSSTPASKKVQLLQNGQRFAPVVQALASSPLAKELHVTVTKVTLEGPDRASVVYDLSLAGQTLLKNQMGTAVRVGGAWRISERDFCALLSLQGTAPPACRSG